MSSLSIINWRRNLSISLFITLAIIGTFHICFGLFFLINRNNGLFSEILCSDTILTKVSYQLGHNITVILFGTIEILSGYLLYYYYKSKTKALLGISMNTILFATTLSFSHVTQHANLASEALFKNALLIKDFTLLGIGLLLFGYMITNQEN